MDTSSPVFAILSSNMESVYAERGTKWVHELPARCAESAEKWGLTNLTPVPNMTFNFVAKGVQGDRSIVLKISCDLHTFVQEKKALTHFRGKGMAALLSHDDQRRALLIERLDPGESLKDLEQPEAELIYADVVNEMHSKIRKENGFRHIRSWLHSLDSARDLPQDLCQQAIAIKEHLLRTAEQETVLHGDLHPDNIVQSDTWKAIDPKGIIGEVAFEVAAFDYRGNTNLPALLSIDPERYHQWVFVRGMLGAAWCVEDRMNPAQFLTWAEKSQARL